MQRTIGQALDIAVAHHEKAYPESKVYAVTHISMDRVGGNGFVEYRVEFDASHFSCTLSYLVDAMHQTVREGIPGKRNW